jgi:single-strand DNA-binding protein
LQIRSYEDNQGVKRKVAEVVADDVRFLDRGGRATEGAKSNDYEGPNVDDINISEDDVPF